MVNQLSIIERMITKAQSSPRTIIYPEGDDTNVLMAARELVDNQVLWPILLSVDGSTEQKAQELEISLDGIQVIDIRKLFVLTTLKEKLAEQKLLVQIDNLDEILADPLKFACAYSLVNPIHGIVAGIRYSTKNVIVACLKLLGVSSGTRIASSLFVMDTENYSGSEGPLLIFADCAVNINPSAQDLADIATMTAAASRRLLDWQPRVGMLSFSTNGSAKDASIDRIRTAIEIVRSTHPEIQIDGEMQFDAAILPEIAVKKGMASSSVAGKANILIFPDLNSGNIGYKVAQRLANTHAYGPLMLGFNKAVSDLSRGSTVEDVVGASIMTALIAE